MHIGNPKHIGSIRNLAMPVNITPCKIIFCYQGSVKKLLDYRYPLNRFIEQLFRLGRNIIKFIVRRKANIGKSFFIIDINLGFLHF